MAAVGLVVIGSALLVAAFAALPGSDGFMPHGTCYLWNPSLVLLHVSSDALIGISYTVIALTLAYLVYRGRADLPFHWMALAFGTFIIACGGTHFMEVWTLWIPSYWLSGGIKLITAVASVATAIALPPLVPKALQLVEAEKVSEARRRELAESTHLLEQAESANRSKDQFVAMVSHELRTPLSPILAWVRMLQLDHGDEQKLQQGLQAIERSARTQAQLIDDLLDISRIAAGKLRLDVRPTELPPVIEAALSAVASAADAKSIRLEKTLDRNAGAVSGDPDRLQQVVWNLLSNAIKFTPKGGRVNVELARVDSQIQITVSDSGCGLEPDALPHLFQRFWQADSGADRQHGGLGLGLAIVRHIVELHGGSVSAHSEGSGRGAQFCVVLPVRPLASDFSGAVHPHRRADEPSSDAPGPALPRLDGLHVLAVDDEPDTRAMLEALLKGCGAVVRTAASAREALALLAESSADVLLSDIGMPGEDGYALIREVRLLSRELGGTVPAVALTAHARLEDRIRVLASGFQMHVTKPVDPVELVTVIANLAGRKIG
jgi:signal transduction histidine kinase